MKKAVKFATQMDEEVLSSLKGYASEKKLTISSIVTQAIDEYLKKYKVRPAFRESMENVIDRNKDLLKKLAS